jgi:glycosyltransferase involved in cell wall biosynthesis
MLIPSHVAGGMEIHSLELAKGIVERGHEVVVVTTRHPEAKTYEEVDGVKIFYVDEPATSKKPMGEKALKKLEELNGEKPFDILHSQSFAAHYYIAKGYSQRLGIPLVTTLHGTPSTEIKSNLNQGLTFMLFPKILFHTFNHHFRLKNMIRRSDAVIAISKELEERIPNEFQIQPEKVKPIYNGIDTTLFAPKESPVKKEYKGKRLILSISVLHRQKGIQYLIEAIDAIKENNPTIHLIVVGDGPHREELESLVRRLSLDELVTFKGKVGYDSLWMYYCACDVFAIPTVRVEGLPLIELEAMSSGCAVVASDIGGIPTVIEDGQNGLLTKAGDSNELAENIGKVLEDDELSTYLRKKARETIEKDFSKDVMVEKTLKVYEEVMT